MIDGAVDCAGAHAPVDRLLAQNTADQSDGTLVSQIGNGGSGQVDLAHQLALKPHLPLLVGHLGQAVEGYTAAGHHQRIKLAYLGKQRLDGGGIAHVDRGITTAVADPDHLMIFGKQFTDRGADGAGGTHNHNFHLHHSWLGCIDSSATENAKKRVK